MRKLLCLTSLFILCTAGPALAQEVLPRITVKNINKRIVISWRNRYPTPVSTITIQRSYDSLRNYSTIGTVLNPQNEENGYVDENPPYDKMYYRVFVSFSGGHYIFSTVARPVKDNFQLPTVTPVARPTDPVITSIPPNRVPVAKDTIARYADSLTGTYIKPPLPAGTDTLDVITYPSRRIFTGKENNVIIQLYDAALRKYQVKFFDEQDKPVFELSRVPEAFLILDKVNFIRSGWFFFEIYDNGKLLERNRIYIPKDTR